jgi:hypothetical protein
VRLTMAMDRALTEAMHEIVEFHRCYDEQEQVIKDRNDLIIELRAEVDSEGDGDSDSGPDYDRDNDGGADGYTEDDPKEFLEGDASQDQAPQPEPELEEVPQEDEPHHVVEPQAGPEE